MTTRFNNGVTNVAQTSTLGDFLAMDPTKVITYFNDFMTYVAGDWTITTTEAGAGSATEAPANVAGGVLLVTTDDADNDNDFLQLKGEPFTFATGKKTWFKTRFACDDATQSDIVFGLQITDTSPLAVTDGVYFIKDDGAATFDLEVMKNSTSTSTTSVATLVDDTYISLGFYFDGVDKIKVFVNDAHVATSVTTNMPDDEELTVSFGIQAGEAAAKALSVDYLFAATER